MKSRNFFLCIALVFFQTFGLLTAIHPPSYGSRTRIWRHRQGKPTLEMNSGIGVRTDTRHPLDPLTEVEINASSNIILNYKRGNWIFISISLKEPEKSVLLPYFLNDTTPPRTSVIPSRSFTILLDGVANQAHEVTVNLNTRRVEVWDLAPLGASPSFTPEEQEESMKIARENATVQERCRRLGWANMSLVYPDPTSMGYVGDTPEYRGRRLLQLFLFGKNFEDDNEYADPFDILVVVDLIERKVIDIEELPTHDDFDGKNKEGNIPMNNFYSARMRFSCYSA